MNFSWNFEKFFLEKGFTVRFCRIYGGSLTFTFFLSANSGDSFDRDLLKKESYLLLGLKAGSISLCDDFLLAKASLLPGVSLNSPSRGSIILLLGILDLEKLYALLSSLRTVSTFSSGFEKVARFIIYTSCLLLLLYKGRTTSEILGSGRLTAKGEWGDASSLISE